MNRQLSIMLVDDHALLREMLGIWLQAAPDLHVVASVGNADDAVIQAIQLRPDVVLMDIDMPGMQAFEGARLIRMRCPETRVVFLSAFTHDRYIEQALAVGASGYITKAEPPAAVLRALRSVAGGAAYFSPQVEARIVLTTDGMRLAQAPRTRAALLTAREVEILRYLAHGRSKKEIAAA